jgi:16S rRNA (adenine1518-N6/adenine1519-N6)-dimethyltransferase
MKGQNFLVDSRIADRQIKYASLSDRDIVLEIGAGYGVLTKRIAAKARKVLAVEMDSSLADTLKGIPNVDVICDNVLNIDFTSLVFNKVIANLPYQISSPVTFKLLESDFELGILMYQKEFAERLAAGPEDKDYSRLSVMASYAADWDILEVVSPSAFRPRPKVNSAVVKVVPGKPKFEVMSKEIFFETVRVLFSHRRKKIKNSLVIDGLLTADESEDVPYGERRVEELSPHSIGEISDVIAERRKNERENQEDI